MQDEWTAWLNQHGAALILFARQWAPAHADAEDIVQEAFVRFWRSRHRATDPVAYLYTCVKYCGLEWLRSRRRRLRREEAAARPERQHNETLFFGPLEQAERRQALEAALRRLPDEQREVVVLKIWGGLALPQIAEAIHISANTVASRYRYALAKLRDQLTEERIS